MSETLYTSSNEAPPKPQAPTPLAGLFVRDVLGFGVWVAIGLSPFLRTVNVPLFKSLLSLYPQTLHWVVPLSGLLMGILGMYVEFAAGQRLVSRSINRWFRRSLGLFLACLVLLIALYPWLVTRVSYADGKVASFVTGPSVPAIKSPDCGCEVGMVRAACIENISFDPARIEACFGTQQVLLSSQVLVFLYLLLTGSVAACGGLLVLQAERRRRKSTD